MQDEPRPSELLDAASRFLREGMSGLSQSSMMFHARVTGNAIDAARRELELAPEFEKRELERLRGLLNSDGSIEELNKALAAGLRSGELLFDGPMIEEHLWLTTMEKLAVDQPNYSAHRRALTLLQVNHFPADHLRNG